MPDGSTSGDDLTSAGDEMGAGVIGAIVAGLVLAAGLVAAGWWVRQRKMRAKQGAGPLYTTGPVKPPQSSQRVPIEPLPEPKTIPTPQSKEAV